MHPRGSVSRASSVAASDPLSAAAAEAAAHDDAPAQPQRRQRSVSARHERLQDMPPTPRSDPPGSALPSTGLSSKPPPPPPPRRLSDSTASLLPDGSLGRRAWQHFQAAESAADLRAMVADSPTSILVLAQAPAMGDEDMNALLGDNVLFAEAPLPPAGEPQCACKFTTASGIYGTVDRSHVGALGVLPPMEDLMRTVGETDSPRATLFDVLDAGGAVLQRLAVAGVHPDCCLPDGRPVHVIIADAPLEHRRVVDSAVSTLASRARDAVESTYAALLPHAERPPLLPPGSPASAALDAAMAFAHAVELRSAPAPLAWIARRADPADAAPERWQDAMRQLQDHVMVHLAALEQTTSMCGDHEARRRICAAVAECVEKLVMEAVYVRVFSTADDRAHDERFAARVAALNAAGLALDHLGLARSLDLQRIAVAAGRILGRIDAVRSPAEKLKLVVDAHKCVVDRVQALNEQKRGAELATDCILPLLIYAIVKTNPPRLSSNLRFIQRYRTRALLAAQFEYCMTNAQAAASFVESADPRKLGLPADAQPAADGRSPTVLPALSALHTVGMDVVHGVAGGGKKVAVGVYDATLGRLLDSQLMARAPWRSLADQELQGVAAPAADAPRGAIDGVRDALATASEQLSYEIKGHLPRSAAPPAAPVVIDRFLDVAPNDLRVGDIALLLKSYRELALHIRSQ